MPTAPANSGEAISVSWEVANQGARDTRQGEWFDSVYLSQDASLDFEDRLLTQVKRKGGLSAGASYTQTATFTLPDGIEGDYHLIFFTDSNLSEKSSGGLYLTFSQVPEFGDEDNNLAAASLRIDLTPPPDLQVTSIIAPERATVGQQLSLSYTVKNEGPGATPTRQSSWQDRIYLSRDKFLDTQRDRYLASVPRNNGLEAGGSYTVNQTIDLPSDLTGAYYVFVVTDPAQQQSPRGNVFEGSAEGNNSTASNQPVILALAPPSDLEVSTIKIPQGAKSGESVTIEWVVTNQGENAAAGRWSDAVYLSTNDQWDIGDIPLGRLLQRRTVGVGESYTSSLTVNLPPAVPGDYRIIVRPDIFNQIYEAENEANNTTASADTLAVTVEELRLGVPLDIVLDPGEEQLFQITVGAGQTLQINVDSASANAANELFVRFNQAPNGVIYDASYSGELGPDPVAVIPTTEPGTYYVLVRGYKQPGQDTPTRISAKMLPFSITNVATDRGGDSRYVTTEISGAQFHPDAIVKLVRPGIAEYVPERYEVVNSTKAIAIFDLTNAPHGLYDVKVINPDGTEAIVPYRYLVERLIEPEVTVGLGGPRVLAPGEAGTYGISLKSLSNLDTPYTFFQFGIPELGNNSQVFGLPYATFRSNLRGAPSAADDDIPWASIVSDVNTDGQLLAPGYVLDLATGGSIGQTFEVHTYEGLAAAIQKYPGAWEDVLDGDVAFRFNILASATALTRAEFVAQQTAEALRLRDAIFNDPEAAQSLVILAADANTWTTAYLAALEEAGLLRPEEEAPPIRESAQVIS